MDQAAQAEGRKPVLHVPVAVSATFEGGAGIGEARQMARVFLESLQAVHGLPVSGRAMGMVQLVVSELVTNARKYALGPCELTLEVTGGAVKIGVADGSSVLPWVPAADPERVGQHGLELVMAVCRTFCVQREPAGKRISATVVLADDPDGDAAGHQAL
ncbi:ATP-binding protein [Streptomyces sp. NPDC060011]|uniref:ATP-binding protein n=1 Tax=Streptomyces sp. NPDC060011 TaxID=3347037 RepID=UPI00368E0F42